MIKVPWIEKHFETLFLYQKELVSCRVLGLEGEVLDFTFIHKNRERHFSVYFYGNDPWPYLWASLGFDEYMNLDFNYNVYYLPYLICYGKKRLSYLKY